VRTLIAEDSAMRRIQQRALVPRASVLAPWIVTLVLFAAISTFAVAATLSPEFGMDVPTAGFLLLICLWAFVQSTVGTAIAWRRPGNRIGRLMQLTAPLIVSVFTGYLVGAIRYLTHGPTDPVGAVAAWWSGVMIYPVLFLAFPALALLFPDGRLPNRQFRGPIAVIVGTLAVIVVVPAFARVQVNEGLPDNPFGILDVPVDLVQLLASLGGLALVAGMLAGIAAVVVRWRRGSVSERAQLKWLLAPLGLGVASFGFAFGSTETDVADLVSFVSALLVPVAVGIAVLRYRLYDIDRLLSRSVSWGVITGALLGVFALTVVALQAVLGSVTQGETLAVAASTLLSFALFQPLRRRIQAAVDRRFDRAHYDAQRVVDAFGGGLRHETDIRRVTTNLGGSARAAVAPASYSIWLRRRGEER
jgi:hypothetical protein